MKVLSRRARIEWFTLHYCDGIGILREKELVAVAKGSLSTENSAFGLDWGLVDCERA